MPADEELQNSPTWVPVVALALRRSDDLWLMHQRPEGKHHGGLWEFPGGKVEPGEMPRDALVREAEEELGIRLNPGDLTAGAFADDPASTTVVILLYTCVRWKGEPRSREGGAIAWCDAAAMRGLDKPPLDRKLVETVIGFSAL